MPPLDLDKKLADGARQSAAWMQAAEDDPELIAAMDGMGAAVGRYMAVMVGHGFGAPEAGASAISVTASMVISGLGLAAL